jgi:hypothetical protein
MQSRRLFLSGAAGSLCFLKPGAFAERVSRR